MMTNPNVWLMTMLMMTMISGARGPHHPCSSLLDRDNLLSGEVQFFIIKAFISTYGTQDIGTFRRRLLLIYKES